MSSRCQGYCWGRGCSGTPAPNMDMICTKKGVKKPFMPKSKVWRLNEDTTRVEFENEFQRLAGGPSGIFQHSLRLDKEATQA